MAGFVAGKIVMDIRKNDIFLILTLCCLLTSCTTKTTEFVVQDLSIGIKYQTDRDERIVLQMRHLNELTYSDTIIVSFSPIMNNVLLFFADDTNVVVDTSTCCRVSTTCNGFDFEATGYYDLSEAPDVPVLSAGPNSLYYTPTKHGLSKVLYKKGRTLVDRWVNRLLFGPSERKNDAIETEYGCYNLYEDQDYNWLEFILPDGKCSDKFIWNKWHGSGDSLWLLRSSTGFTFWGPNNISHYGQTPSNYGFCESLGVRCDTVDVYRLRMGLKEKKFEGIQECFVISNRRISRIDREVTR